MAVMQWWVGVLVMAVALAVGLTARWWRRRGTASAAVPAAGLDRIRRLPLFKTLARGELRRRRLEAAGLALALLGAGAAGSRIIGISDDSEEMHTRDIVLCMDVSASMAPLVGDVLDSYLALVDSLEGERIGFVMFDAYAVTGFPLTTDYPYVVAQLRAAKKDISAGQVPGTQAPRSGSSLVGDGLATCVQRFDRPEDARSRTVVLATDNLVSGDAVYSVPQATELAMDQDVMVFGVMPRGSEPVPTRQLREESERTGGRTLTLDAGRGTNAVTISDAVESQQKAEILTRERERSFDLIWPGGLLLVLGAAVALGSVWRRR